jgi:flagella basal body P-ring formation protein FlgA
MNRLNRFFILLSIFLGQTSIAATSADDIHAVVNQFTEQHIAALQQQYGTDTRIESKINHLDPRLSLADCPSALNTTMKQGGSKNRINVKVSCSKGKNWSIYVPVMIDIYRPVVVTLEPIARGTALNDSMLQLQEVSVSQLQGSYFTNIAAVEGMVAKRLINSGSTVTSAQVTPPLVIKKGDAVLVTASTSGLKVKMPGTALNDGRQGEQIRVKNNHSKRTIDARVTGPGQVKVLM